MPGTGRLSGHKLCFWRSVCMSDGKGSRAVRVGVSRELLAQSEDFSWELGMAGVRLCASCARALESRHMCTPCRPAPALPCWCSAWGRWQHEGHVGLGCGPASMRAAGNACIGNEGLCELCDLWRGRACFAPSCKHSTGGGMRGGGLDLSAEQSAMGRRASTGARACCRHGGM